jgi:3-hydroxybutyryl-CoA dehydrogenase
MMDINDLRTVLVIGAGTMGSQIALQCAMHGFEVNLYDISPENLEKGMQLIHGYVDSLIPQGIVRVSDADSVFERIHPTTNLNHAAQADLVSESIPEDPKLKGDVFAQFNQLCPAHTIFATNTSTLLPSYYAEATGRPDRFAALHFHNYVWSSNIVDIMPHPGTAEDTLDLLEAFALRIGQIPIRLTRESHSYVFNAMLNAFLRAATSLVSKQVTSVENVDRAWMGVMKTKIGPFGILDQVGLETAYDINQYWADRLNDPELHANASFLKTYVAKGWLGVKTGRGFYSYPNPEYAAPGFLNGEG